MISVLILTKNEEQDLPRCLESVRWSDDVHVYDSYSTDGTLEIAEAAGARVTQREFDDWSSHQNWGLANIPFRDPWVLYVDADERVTPELAASIRRAVENPGNKVASHSAAGLLGRELAEARAGILLLHAAVSPGEDALRAPSQSGFDCGWSGE